MSYIKPSIGKDEPEPSPGRVTEQFMTEPHPPRGKRSRQPKGGNVRLCVSIPEPVVGWIEALAKARGWSRSRTISELIKEKRPSGLPGSM